MTTCFADPLFDYTLVWLAASSLVGLVAMGVDKSRAINYQRRIPEMALLTESAIGGFPGVVAGAFIFHHKTSKPSFMLIALASIVPWILVLYRVGFFGCFSLA